MLYNLANIRKTRQRESGYALRIKKLQIPRRAKIAITGPSGCGKSTALDILGFSLAPDSADQFIFYPNPNEPGADVMRLWRENRQESLTELRLLHLGFVLQSGELFPYLSVGENICLSGRLGAYNMKDIRESGRQLAELLGIADLWKAPPATLSIGERQRAAIGRALASRPQVILADEPTAALDPFHAKKVMDAFMHCVEDFGSALILATHDVNWARSGGFRELPFQLQKSDDGVMAILDEG